jgi:hypothetical protein
MNVLAGSTDVTTYFALRLAADGTDATGLTITNIDLQYTRSGDAPAAKVDATALAATNSAHGDNQAIEIDATDQPGLYRVDWPDAAFASGVREVVLTVKCATAFTEHLRVNLTPVPANAVQVSGDATAADTLELFAEALDQATGQLDSGSFAASAITATVLAADCITAAKIADGAIDAATFAAGAITATVIATGAVDADAIAADAVTEIQSGLATSSALSSLETRLRGLVMVQGTIGSTGNSTTALHLSGLTYGDDELNDYLLVIFDVSESEYHARWVEDWADTGDLATVATLPFTPQNATDTYWLLPVRQDVSGGSGLDAAGVRAAVGLASANLDTQLGDLPTNAELATSQAAADDATLAAIAALNNLSAAQVNAEVDAALADVGLTTTITGRIDAAVSTRATPAQVNTECDTALADYDAPTNAEMVARTLVAADYATASALATIDDFLDTEIAAIKTVTDQFTAAQSEPSAVPAANATPLQKLAWLAALARNRIDQTATTQTLKNDAGSGNIGTATVSDDGTTFTREEWA